MKTPTPKDFPFVGDNFCSFNKLKIILLIIIAPVLAFAQPSPTQQRIKDFGFSTKNISSFTTNVNGAFDVVFETNEIFYVNSTNQICSYKNISGVWTNLGVINASAPAIRAGGQIHRTGNKIYYVSNSNSKIYRLENTTGTTWLSTLLLTTQTLVRSDADILYSYPHIYYIGTTGAGVNNNRVCEIITSDGINWTGGAALVTTSSLVRSNSKIIQPLNISLLYYIGASTNGVYELAYNIGPGWTGGLTFLSSANVKIGTNLETNGYAFYYVNGATNKVSALYWSSGWQTINFPCIENVRTDVALKYIDNTIFYVGATSGKINILSLNGAGVWSAIPVDPIATIVKTGSKILAYANSIFEEGSSWATFNSVNVFYVDNADKLRYYVFDDSPCISGYHYHDMLWDTEACKVGGAFPKEWHFGPDPNIVLPNSVKSNLRIGQINKDIYFIDPSNIIKQMNRSVPNNPITFNTSWVLSFSDEFNSLLTTQTKWNTQFPHGNVHKSLNKSHYNDYNNLSYNSGIMNIETKQYGSPETFNFWRKGFFWNDSCLTKQYDYSSSSLQTGCLNCNTDISPVPQLVNCDSAPPVEEHTFSQKYGWFEMRTKSPRGKGLWNAFWLLPRDNQYTWTNEIDVFEIPGNGKYIAQTNWTNFNPDESRNNEAKIIDCIGYRTYEDFHTYAVKWTGTDITFYYDNKQVGYALTSYVPTASEMYMIINNYVNEENGSDMMMESEVLNFPNYWGIDYVRAYTPFSLPKSFDAQEQKKSINIYPNPALDQITIDDDAFSKAEIFNVQGAKISESVSKAIDVKSFSKGVYFIKITNLDGKVHNSKFIKE